MQYNTGAGRLGVGSPGAPPHPTDLQALCMCVPPKNLHHALFPLSCLASCCTCPLLSTKEQAVVKVRTAHVSSLCHPCQDNIHEGVKTFCPHAFSLLCSLSLSRWILLENFYAFLFPQGVIHLLALASTHCHGISRYPGLFQASCAFLCSGCHAE